MRTVTLASMRAQARQRADVISSSFFADDEVNGYINSSLTELYDMIRESNGDNYYLSSSTFTTSASVSNYSLPSDCLTIKGVNYVQGTQKFSIPSDVWSKRNRNVNSGSPVKWILYGPNTIHFTTPPSGQYQIEIEYVPAPATLVNDSDTFDGISGWEEYVIVDAAIKMKQRRQQDPSVLFGQKDRLTKRIETMKRRRYGGESRTLQEDPDLYSGASYWGIAFRSFSW